MRIAREDSAGLDDVRPLVCALKAHHVALAPERGEPADDDAFWRVKRAQYERQLAHEDGALFVARDGDGRAVGFAFTATSTDYVTWPRAAIRVEDIAVAPGARGAGIGRRLMAAIRDHAGPREVRLFVLHANTDALRFYEREGFVARVLDMALPAPD